MKARRILPVLALLGCLFLNTGVIRKDFDPIKNTQTDAIAYKQKMEEIKDGEKGPPTPSYKFYEKQDFLVKTPMQTQAEEVLPPVEDVVTGSTDSSFHGEAPGEEPASESVPAAAGEDWWQDEETGDKASSSDASRDIQASSGTGDAPVWEEKW